MMEVLVPFSKECVAVAGPKGRWEEKRERVSVQEVGAELPEAVQRGAEEREAYDRYLLMFLKGGAILK